MSVKNEIGLGFTKVTTFPYTHSIRRIWVASGDIVVKNDKGDSVTILEAELPSINNQGTALTEITSSTLGTVFVSH